MSHSHSHSSSELRTPARVRRLLAFVTLPFLIASLIGLVLLWPEEKSPQMGAVELPGNLANATVVRIEETACPGLEGTGGLADPVGSEEDVGSEGSDATQRCRKGTARLTSGPQKGRNVTFDLSEGVSPLPVERGDKIVLAQDEGGAAGDDYYFVDRQRSKSMLLLAAMFAIAVLALGRWKGLTALGGLGISLAVLIMFVLPAILAGSDPVAVSIVGAAIIMFVGLYTAHGVTARTTTALLGTLASLAITAAIAFAFVRLSQLTGFSSEEATFLNVAAAGSINFRGLVLAGIVIGSLGVLDDVTVTQASAVWELRASNPVMTAAQLYRSAIRIGRDHIASTVNTLVLAYAGASLPLLILFTVAGSRFRDIVTQEIVAEEVLRTLIGSIGLVASVPITTALAVFVVVRSSPGALAGQDH